MTLATLGNASLPETYQHWFVTTLPNDRKRLVDNERGSPEIPFYRLELHLLNKFKTIWH